MNDQRCTPQDPLTFITRCVSTGRIFWTYHVNMRLPERGISRRMVVEAITEYEIIESNPHDKYLPSYLVRARDGDTIFHVLFAVDIRNDNVRVITAYRPDTGEWSEGLRRRQTR